MLENSTKNQRLAKNTLILYVRMMITMGVTLFTSRITLNILGVEDFGIYNVIAGFVSMFSVISASLSAAISRFITYELGKGDIQKLKNIFSTSVNIQLLISLVIIILCEGIGVWFLNNKMAIPSERIVAANWVLQFSVITFCLNLINVPYNAAIIAHEKMSSFAYISIFEVTFKLLIVYMLLISPLDKLIVYSFLLLCINIILRIIYVIYCKRKFEECSYHLVFDKPLFKEMSKFAGWNFFGSGAYMLNTQGVNMLMNVYYGVTINAARGIATQVDGAVRQFVSSFMTAINPQITKSYASGELDNLRLLICRSSKFSSYLMLFFAIPIIIESDLLLRIWLGIVPDYAAVFLRLTIINTFFDCIFSNSIYTAMMATGDIKKYQVVVTIVGCIVFPLIWLLYHIGVAPEVAYYVYGTIYCILVFVRLRLLENYVKMKPSFFVRTAIVPFLLVLLLSLIVPIIITYIYEDGLLRLITIIITSTFGIVVSIYCIGLTTSERSFILSKIKK